MSGATGPGEGESVALGAYEVPEGERMLVARRLAGTFSLLDLPGGGRGRRYLIEAGMGGERELAALLVDYRRQAERLGSCPMSREGIDRLIAPAAAGG